MSPARLFAALALAGAAVVVACSSSPGSSSRPGVDTTDQTPGVPLDPVESEASAAANGELFYQGCDPTAITDGAIGDCTCFDWDGSLPLDGGEGISITLPCGYGYCISSSSVLRYCTPQHQGIVFPNCPNIFTGPDGSAEIPACAPGAQPISVP